MTKIYAQGNYIVIEANNERKTFPKRDVRFKIIEDGIYSLISAGLPIDDFDYSEVKKEDNSDYATALEFETFLFENTGNFNSGGVSSPNSNDYSIDEIQVGRFIYRNAGGDKVSKPKYRKIFVGTQPNPEPLLLMFDENLGNTFDLEILVRKEGNIFRIDNSISYDLNSVFAQACPEVQSGLVVSAGTYSEIDLQSKSIMMEYYYFNNDENTNNAIKSWIPFNYNLILEYTKTTDPETIIELAP